MTTESTTQVVIFYQAAVHIYHYYFEERRIAIRHRCNFGSNINYLPLKLLFYTKIACYLFLFKNKVFIKPIK